MMLDELIRSLKSFEMGLHEVEQDENKVWLSSNSMENVPTNEDELLESFALMSSIVIYIFLRDVWFN